MQKIFYEFSRLPGGVQGSFVLMCVTLLIMLVGTEKGNSKNSYITYASKVSLIFFLIFVLIFIKTTVMYINSNDLIGSIISICITLLFFALFWQRLSFRVEIKNEKFVVRNLFMKNIEYNFHDLTDYKSYNYKMLFLAVAYIGKKRVFCFSNWDINYEKLEDTILNYVEKDDLH